MFKIKRINDPSMDMNTYLLIKQENVIVIDPGFNGQEILKVIEENQYVIKAVLLTHGHYDHIRDIDMLSQRHAFDLYVHQKDVELLTNPNLNYSTAFNQSFKMNSKNHLIKIEEDTHLEILDETIRVLHTPGHTFGSVIYIYKYHVFSGDTIFYDSIGRTDLFSGNFNAIRRSIRKVKSALSNQMTIYPGHGRKGNFKDIQKENRFLQ